MNPKELTVMLDCSRNGVMKPEKVKEFALPVVDRQMRRIYQEVEKEYAIADGGSY